MISYDSSLLKIEAMLCILSSSRMEENDNMMDIFYLISFFINFLSPSKSNERIFFNSVFTIRIIRSGRNTKVTYLKEINQGSVTR